MEIKIDEQTKDLPEPKSVFMAPSGGVLDKAEELGARAKTAPGKKPAPPPGKAPESFGDEDKPKKRGRPPKRETAKARSKTAEKTPESIKDTNAAIHRNVERLEDLVAEHKKRHPESKVGAVVNPLDATQDLKREDPLLPENTVEFAVLALCEGLATLVRSPARPSQKAIRQAAHDIAELSKYWVETSEKGAAVMAVAFSMFSCLSPIITERVMTVAMGKKTEAIDAA